MLQKQDDISCQRPMVIDFLISHFVNTSIIN